jgi:hypothetical protein
MRSTLMTTRPGIGRAMETSELQTECHRTAGHIVHDGCSVAEHRPAVERAVSRCSMKRPGRLGFRLHHLALIGFWSMPVFNLRWTQASVGAVFKCPTAVTILAAALRTICTRLAAWAAHFSIEGSRVRIRTRNDPKSELVVPTSSGFAGAPHCPRSNLGGEGARLSDTPTPLRSAAAGPVTMSASEEFELGIDDGRLGLW